MGSARVCTHIKPCRVNRIGFARLQAGHIPVLLQVVLPDEKDNDRDVVVFLDAALATETEDNAQQLGALAALHRVAGDRAMHRILPEQYLLTWEAYGREVMTPHE